MTKTISTSKTKKITTTIKNFNENLIRDRLNLSNPHSKGWSLPRRASDSLAASQTRMVNVLSSDAYPLATALIVYLLVALVVVVKRAKFYKGALRRV